MLSSSRDDSAALVAPARLDHVLGLRQRPPRDFSHKSARYDVTTLDMDPDKIRLVGLQCPQQAPTHLIPEPQQAIGAACHHQAVRREGCVRKEPRAPSVGLKELACRSIPQPGCTIAARGDDPISCYPARRKYSTDVTHKFGDDAMALEVDQHRRCGAVEVDREGDQASPIDPQRHDAPRKLEVCQDRAALVIDPQSSMRIGRNHVTIKEECRSIDAPGGAWKCKQRAAIARHEQRAVDCSADKISSRRCKGHCVDGRTVRDRPQQPATG